MCAHDELMAQLHERPEDEAAWAVLQDWLLVHEDPRGKLAVASQEEVVRLLEGLFGCPVQVEPDRVSLEGAGGTLLRLELARGHVRKLVVCADWGQELAEVLARVLSQPVGRLLLEVGIGSPPLGARYRALLEALVEHGPLAIRTFTSGGGARPEWLHDPDLSLLWGAAPWLERASLTGRSVRLGALHHERLRHLELVTASWPGPLLQELGQAHLPALQALHVTFGRDAGDPALDAAGLQPLLDCELPSLRRVRLGDGSSSRGLAPHLLRARWFPQLEELDLSELQVTERDAGALLEGAYTLPHLERLDLSGALLSQALEGRLREALGARVVL
jgi:hypothetical protein